MDSELLIPRIRDAIRICDTSSMPKFLGFLTSEESAIVNRIAEQIPCRYELYGGYDSAERLVFGVFPDWCEDRDSFRPVTSVTATYRIQDKPTHRDFLGALMSLGIKRESVGDILVGEGRTVIFLMQDVLSAVMNGLSKVANIGLSLSVGFDEPLPGREEMKELTDTVASARLDCIVASLVGTSRNAAAALIEAKLVSVNSLCTEKVTKTVANGDRITVRGKGKFVIDSVDTRTKKDRIVLKAKKYV